MPHRETDYSNTIIYKIYCKDERIKDVYVGHTTNFVQRKKAHASSCMKTTCSNHNCKLYKTIRQNGNWDNWVMDIIAFYNCKNANEARQKEQYHYVELKATLNSIEPMRSMVVEPKTKKSNGHHEDNDNGEVCHAHDTNLHSDNVNNKYNKTLNNKRVSYACQPCAFHTTSRRDYERHLLTQKHLDGGSICKAPIKTPEGYSCPNCHNTYKSRTSTYTHISKCGIINNTEIISGSTQHDITIESSSMTENYISEVISKNQELTTANQELRSAMMLLIQQNTVFQSKMMEICKSGGIHNITNSNNTNSNNTNCNNPTFNMNMFLNEKCKDAMNMKDFVNSIQLNMTDMENMDRLGYVEGMSTIFINNLQKTDLYKRPVHCSDMKRDTLYVKENDQWEREGPDHAKMTKAVLAVEHKNVVLVNEWANANPRCLNSNTRENEKYFRLSTIVTDGDKEGNIAKVIRKVAKRVGIERTSEGGE